MLPNGAPAPITGIERTSSKLKPDPHERSKREFFEPSG
jgi:hypothetical protein